MISNLMVQLGNHTNAQLDENMLRHMILNSLRSYRVKFGTEYKELVIACDNRHYWRKQVFPYYKANRKKSRDESDIDWNAVFECLNKLRADLKEFFPYKLIEVENAEADDIIGTLVNEYGTDMNYGDPILILSGDKDFIQLHRHANVKQYNPVLKKWIIHPDPEQYLFEHILRGDKGDGIPNVLSPDNCLVIGERQKTLTAVKMQSILETDTDRLPEHINRNYDRNAQLIDLNNTPKEISAKILEQYKVPAGDRSRLMEYFMKNRLKHLMESINEF